MMNKTDQLFLMLEQPQAYTEQQWQEILSDDECRELYALMAKTQGAYDAQKEIDDETIEEEWLRLTHVGNFSRQIPSRRNPVFNKQIIYKIAAMFIGILLISGIAIAAIHIIHRRSEQPAETTVATISEASNPNLQIKEPVRFSNTPLDSLLSVVASHYGRTVCFNDETLRQLRFTIAWDSVQPLSTFLDNVNEFEGLQVVDKRDTIFVNAGKEVRP